MATAAVIGGSAIVGALISSEAQKEAAKTQAGAITGAQESQAAFQQQLLAQQQPFLETQQATQLAQLGLLGLDPQQILAAQQTPQALSSSEQAELDKLLERQGMQGTAINLGGGITGRVELSDAERQRIEALTGQQQAFQQFQAEGPGPTTQELVTQGLQSSPLVQALQEQNRQAIERRGSARALSNSGAILQELQQSNQAALLGTLFGGAGQVGAAAAGGVQQFQPGIVGAQQNMMNLGLQQGDVAAQNALAQGQIGAGLAGGLGALGAFGLSGGFGPRNPISPGMQTQVNQLTAGQVGSSPTGFTPLL